MTSSTIIRIWGGEGRRGYQSRGDSLVNALADNVSFDSVWDEITEGN
jgi:hypothetical protein